MSHDSSPIGGFLAIWIALNAVMGAVLLFEYSSPSSPAGSRSQVQERTLSLYAPVVENDADITDSLPSRLLSPRSQQIGESYPLIVFLHGAGQRGNDNVQQLIGLPEQMATEPWRTDYLCFVWAPQCPASSHWESHLPALQRDLRFIMEAFPIERDRVYLTGLSMGGFGCWSWAAKHADLFAAVVPICGGGDPATASRLVDVRIWAVHGDADRTVPVERTRAIVEAMRASGGNPRYTELPGVGHDCWTATYANREGVMTWMFQQSRDHQSAVNHTRHRNAHTGGRLDWIRK